MALAAAPDVTTTMPCVPRHGDRLPEATSNRVIRLGTWLSQHAQNVDTITQSLSFFAQVSLDIASSHIPLANGTRKESVSRNVDLERPGHFDRAVFHFYFESFFVFAFSLLFPWLVPITNMHITVFSEIPLWPIRRKRKASGLRKARAAVRRRRKSKHLRTERNGE